MLRQASPNWVYEGVRFCRGERPLALTGWRYPSTGARPGAPTDGSTDQAGWNLNEVRHSRIPMNAALTIIRGARPCFASCRNRFDRPGDSLQYCFSHPTIRPADKVNAPPPLIAPIQRAAYDRTGSAFRLSSNNRARLRGNREDAGLSLDQHLISWLEGCAGNGKRPLCNGG